MTRDPLADDDPTGADRSLADLRGAIDRLDRELVGLLNRRAELATAIGRIKARDGLEVYSPAREEEVVARALAAHGGPLPPETVRLIFRELMSGSRAIQRPLRIASLGPLYSYSHLAAVAKFGVAVEHVPLGSIAAVFEEVGRRHVQYGLVPMENSTDGRVADTLDMFARSPGIKIRAEVRLRVRHCLLGRGPRAEVRRVFSKAQALSQCRRWLGQNLPRATLHESLSTADAAETVRDDPHAAAVASRQAGESFGLDILAANIEDQAHNVTRFAVIAEQAEARTGRDKTTLLLRVPNRAGSLSQVLTPFEQAGLNLTMIESFPMADGPPGIDPSYLFFLDVEGHAEDPALAAALVALRGRCERVDVLGSYPRGACVEG